MITRSDLKDEKLSSDLFDEKGREQLLDIGQALSTELRISILKKVNESPISIADLAKFFNTSMSTMVYNCEMLEKAALISIRLMPFKNGNIRICYNLMRSFRLNIGKTSPLKDNKRIRMSCGVGHYIDCDDRYCYNYVDRERMVIARPKNAYSAERYNAGIVFAECGSVTYAFPNEYAQFNQVDELSLTLEICSECLAYDNHYLSDITFWINGIEITTWTSLGDYGDRPGLFNPKWLAEQECFTQYGKLLNILINNKGVYVNGDFTSDRIKLKDLNLNKSNKTTLKIGNKDDAAHKGGFNIFGHDFGDYPNDIVLEAKVSESPFDQNEGK